MHCFQLKSDLNVLVKLSEADFLFNCSLSIGGSVRKKVEKSPPEYNLSKCKKIKIKLETLKCRHSVFIRTVKNNGGGETPAV